MKKALLLVITIITILFILSSCRTKTNYEFLETTDSIEEISIVELSFDDDGALVETEKRAIYDVDVFLDTFKRIDCYKYYGDPLGATQEGVKDTVVKITYKDGGYELISWRGQSKYTVENGLEYYAGYSVFDEAQFKELIESQ